MQTCNKKIHMVKKSLSENRKNIINVQKSNQIILLKLEKLEDYKKIEKKLKLKLKTFKEH